MLKRIRAALLTIALFLGSLAAVGAQSAGPGEAWRGFLIIQYTETTQALMQLTETYEEQPECNNALMTSAMLLTMQGQPPLAAFCTTDTREKVIENIMQQQGEPT